MSRSDSARMTKFSGFPCFLGFNLSTELDASVYPSTAVSCAGEPRSNILKLQKHQMNARQVPVVAHGVLDRSGRKK